MSPRLVLPSPWLVLLVLSAELLLSAAGSTAPSLDTTTTPGPDRASSWELDITNPDLTTTSPDLDTVIGEVNSTLGPDFDIPTSELGNTRQSHASGSSGLTSDSEISTASPDVAATSPGTMFLDILTDACLAGAEQSVIEQLKAGRNRTLEQMKTVLLDASAVLTNGQQDLQQQLKLLQSQHQEEMTAIKTYHQEQMTVLKDELTVKQQTQLTTLRNELISAQQRQLITLEDRLSSDQEQRLKTLHDELTTDQHSLQKQMSDMQDQLKSDQQHLQEELSELRTQLVSSLSSTAHSTPEDCPSGWSRHGTSCYLIPALEDTWSGAFRACSTFDSRARLASVHRANSGDVSALVSASGGLHWVGLFRRAGRTDRWAWTDGSPLDFTNWRRGQPNNGGLFGEGENCGRMYESGNWKDEECSASGKFICQIVLS